MGRNSTNQDDCCQSIDVTNIYTDFIGNPNGPFQIFDDVLPSVDNTYNIGSNALRWKNGYFSTNLFTPLITGPTADLTLNAATGFNIVTSKSVIPDQDNFHSLGLSYRRWSNVYGVTVYTDVLTSPTDTDLLITTPPGYLIKNDRSIQPVTDINTDLGSVTFRYANIYGQTMNSTTINNTTLNTTTINATTGNITNVNATTINATASQNLSLTAGAGFVVTSNQDIQPATDGTKNLGSATKRWQNTYSNSVTATTVSTSGIVTNSVSANPAVDLNISADPGKAIVLNTQMLPVTDNTILLGSASKQWSDIRANQATIASINSTTLTMNNTITTPTGIDLNLTAATGRNIVVSQTLRPAQNNTQNCGATTERWLNMYAQNIETSTITSFTATDLTLNPATGQSVISTKNFLPDASFSRSLGLSTQKWTTLHADSVTVSLVQAPTGSGIPLTLEPVAGQSIVAKGKIEPFTDITYDLGTTLIRWNNTFTKTLTVTDVTVTTIASPTATDLTLNPATGKDLVSTKSFLPSATATHSLGSSLKTWLNGFIDNLTSVSITITDFFKSPADKQGTSFQTSSTSLTATSFTTAPIAINATATFDGGSNQLKFPVKGVYCIDFTSAGDAQGSSNAIIYHLKNTNGGGLTADQYHLIGDPDQSIGKQRLSFLFRCDDPTNDKIVIEYKRTVADVNNWSISEGYCYRVNTFT